MSLSFPSIYNPSEIRWRLRAPTQIHESPLDGTSQTLALAGARWEATLVWATLIPSHSRLLEAFVARLRGRGGRFLYGPIHAARQATGSGTPVINGAGQSGEVLSIRGWAASAQAFRAGDWLSYVDTAGRQRLHQVVADSTANGSGIAAVTITPSIRRAGADGAAVEVTNPQGVFRMASDAADLTVRPGLFGALTLDIAEALV